MNKVEFVLSVLGRSKTSEAAGGFMLTTTTTPAKYEAYCV